MLNFGMIDDRIEEHLDLYFKQCSVLVSCHDLAMWRRRSPTAASTRRPACAPVDARSSATSSAPCSPAAVRLQRRRVGYRIGLAGEERRSGGASWRFVPGQGGIGGFLGRCLERARQRTKQCAASKCSEEPLRRASACTWSKDADGPQCKLVTT
jgi:glutaminase